METLNQFDFLRALGSGLLNSLWQFGLVWLIFRLFVAPIRSLTAAVKHAILIILVSIASTWFVASIISFYQSPTFFSVEENAGIGAGVLVSSLQKAISFFELNMPLLSLLYLVVVTGLMFNFSRYFSYAHRVQTQGLEKPAAQLRLQVTQLAERLGIKKRVDLWVSSLIDTPMIIGFLRPTILLPLASINQLSVSQLEAILLHELAHIRRNDYLLNIYVSGLRILFFFNPFCRMMIESVRQEREKSCDDWVLQFRFDPHQYASALFQLEAARTAGFSLGIAAGGGNKTFLLERIERIMKVATNRRTNRLHLLSYAMIVMLVAVLAAVLPGKRTTEEVKDSFVLNGYRLFNRFADDDFFGAANTEKTETISETITTTSETTRVISNTLAPVEAETNAVAADANEVKEDVIAVNYDAGDDMVVPVDNLVATENIEQREFSIVTPPAPETPVVDEPLFAPFVPQASFSFHDVEDTTRPKVKEESYAERSAKESLVKAKKALEQVDWEKIQKDLLKKGKLTKAEFLKQLEASLDKLNWDAINKEVSTAINKESVERWRASLKAEMDDAAKYKELQAQYQQLKDQLQLQQQNLKKEAEAEGLKLDKEIKKNKVVVHL